MSAPRSLALIAVLVLAPGAAAAGFDPVAPGGGPSTGPARVATRAVILTRTAARAAPSPAAAPVLGLGPRAPLAGGEQALLVTARARRAGQAWLRVLLPVRPNGRQGWIPAHAVRTEPVATRIEVDLGARTLTLRRAGRLVLRTAVAVGTPGTPTPTGRFAVAERVATDEPGGMLGPVVIALTGYSRVLNEYAGGNGRVALHGTSAPSLLGTAASHGCVRVRNDLIRRVAAQVVAGTPVRIRS